MNKLLFLTIFSLTAFNSFAGVIGGDVSGEFSEEEIDLTTVYNTDMVHKYIKNRKDCGQQDHVQVLKYEKFANPGCVNLGVNLLTVFSFEEAIKSYVISDPETNAFFKVGVWISSTDADDNSYINQKSYYVKATFPMKSANIVFLAKSGRQYHFDLKSLSLNSNEIPTRQVYSVLPDDMLEQVKQKEKEKEEERLDYLIESAKRINFEQDNAFVKYMEKIHSGKINTNYKLKSVHEGKAIRPFAVYDNGYRTLFNFDGILSADERPAIAKVLNGVDIPLTVKDAYTLGPDYRGWVYVDAISQEGFTLKLGQGDNAKILCIKTTVDLREFHNPKRKTDPKAPKKEGEDIGFIGEEEQKVKDTKEVVDVTPADSLERVK